MRTSSTTRVPCRFRPAPSIDASCATIHGPIVDWGRSLEPSSLGVGLGQHHVQDCTEARNSSGRDPPRDLRLQAASRRPRRLSFVRADSTYATDGSVRSIFPRVLFRMQSWPQFGAQLSRQVAAGPTLRSVREVLRRDSLGVPNIGEPQARAEKKARKGQRTATREPRPAKVVEFPKGIGSSGWIRTSNPSVNRRKKKR
jgi:hypothetical protein